MGIKGLHNLLGTRSDLHDFFIQAVRKGSKLLIDGNNFMFFIMNIFTNDKKPIDRRYGGSYREFRDIIHREIKFLLQLGFEIEFYFDGSHSGFKDLVIEERKTSLFSAWKNCYRVITFHEKVINQGDLPLPTLTRLLFEIILRRDFPDLPIIDCRGEADIDLGCRCAEINRKHVENPMENPKKAYIYSDDSDFYAMKDCLTIKCQSFSLNFMESDYTYFHEKDDVYYTEVFEREKLAKFLGFVNVSQFIEFVLLLGCDFTRMYDRSKYLYSTEKPRPPITTDNNHVDDENTVIDQDICEKFLLQYSGNSGGIAMVSELHAFVRLQGGNFKLHSSDMKLQLCLAYSRDFYEGEINEETYQAKFHILADQTKEDDDESDDYDFIQDGDSPSNSDDDDNHSHGNDDTDENNINEDQMFLNNLFAQEEAEIEGSEIDPSIIVTQYPDYIPYIPKSIKIAYEEFLQAGIYTFPCPLTMANAYKVMLHYFRFTTAPFIDANMILEPIHILAFQEMFEEIENNPETFDNHYLEDPRWIDVKAAKYLQEFLVLTMKNCVGEFELMKNGDQEVLQSLPKFFFDGKVYHRILRKLRLEQLQSQEPTIEEIQRLELLLWKQRKTIEFLHQFLSCPDYLFEFGICYFPDGGDFTDFPGNGGEKFHFRYDRGEFEERKYKNALTKFFRKQRKLENLEIPEDDADFQFPIDEDGFYFDHEDDEEHEHDEHEDDEDEDDEEEDDDHDDDSTIFEIQKLTSELSLESNTNPDQLYRPLPVDAYEEIILQKLQQDRLLIVRGETGCGKSTRIPVMILNHARANEERCRILVCEPSRSAATNLYLRVSTQIDDSVGLRLGMNVHEGPEDAAIMFATSGYLFNRYVGNLEALGSFTHIIIDEVHERSIENDLICLIVNQLYRTADSKLRVILMSATVESEIFYNYFQKKDLFQYPAPLTNNNNNHPDEIKEQEEKENAKENDNDDESYEIIPITKQNSFTKPEFMRQLSNDTFEHQDDYSIWVGTKRFDTKIYYIEDLLPSNREQMSHLETIFSYDFFVLSETINDICSQNSLSTSLFKKQCELSMILLKTCSLGSSILIFVPGMAEINFFQNAFRGEAYEQYKLFSIHSELDNEEERKAFENFTEEEKSRYVRVIVATNAAESSITLPDLAIVICFGTNNVEEYDSSHFARTTLKTQWISQPSAIQRAGRTGRTSEGIVYRLYTEDLYKNSFPMENEPDIRLKPLHDAIIRVLGHLQGTFGRNSIQDLLIDFIQPPDLWKLQDSLLYLYRNHMITTHLTTTCALTALGQFASKLPLSIHLSRFLYNSFIFDIGKYGIIIAAILSNSSYPFRNQKFQFNHPDYFNQTIKDVFLGNLDLDSNEYSETILLLKLYLKWKVSNDKAKGFLCYEYCLDRKKMNKLDDHVRLLKRKIGQLFSPQNNINLKKIYDTTVLPFDSHNILTTHGSGYGLNLADLYFIKDRQGLRRREKLILLRFLLVWCADGNILRIYDQKIHNQENEEEKEEEEKALQAICGDRRSLYGRYIRDIYENTALLYDHVYVKEKQIKELYPQTKTVRAKDYTPENKKMIEEPLVPNEYLPINRRIHHFEFQIPSQYAAMITPPAVAAPSHALNIVDVMYRLFNDHNHDNVFNNNGLPMIWSWSQLPEAIRIPIPASATIRSRRGRDEERFLQDDQEDNSMALTSFLVVGFWKENFSPEKEKDFRTIFLSSMLSIAKDKKKNRRNNTNNDNNQQQPDYQQQEQQQQQRLPPIHLMSLKEFLLITNPDDRLINQDAAMEMKAQHYSANVEYFIITNPLLLHTIYFRQLLLFYSSGLEIHSTLPIHSHSQDQQEQQDPVKLSTYFSLFPSDPITLKTKLNLSIRSYNYEQTSHLTSYLNSYFHPFQITSTHTTTITNSFTSPVKTFALLKYSSKRSNNNNQYFQDLTTGIRLLNCYCKKRPNRTFGVGSLYPIKSIEHPETNQKEPEWGEVHVEKATNLRGIFPQWQILQTTMDTRDSLQHELLGNRIVPRSFHDVEWSNSFLQKDSYLITSFPRPLQSSDTVYAIANNVITSKRGEKETISSDQVTFLPYSKTWLLMAMALSSLTLDDPYYDDIRDYPEPMPTEDNPSPHPLYTNWFKLLRKEFDELIRQQQMPYHHNPNSNPLLPPPPPPSVATLTDAYQRLFGSIQKFARDYKRHICQSHGLEDLFLFNLNGNLVPYDITAITTILSCHTTINGNRDILPPATNDGSSHGGSWRGGGGGGGRGRGRGRGDGRGGEGRGEGHGGRDGPALGRGRGRFGAAPVVPLRRERSREERVQDALQQANQQVQQVRQQFQQHQQQQQQQGGAGAGGAGRGRYQPYRGEGRGWRGGRGGQAGRFN